MLQRFQRIRETDMKKLILITGILLSTSLWASPVEEFFCKVERYNDIATIRNVCVKNSIIMFRNLEPDWATWAMAEYCRFDRHIHLREYIPKQYGMERRREKLIAELTCVLHDNLPRGSN